MEKCTKRQAEVLKQFGHKIFAELDLNLQPVTYYVGDRGTTVVGKGKQRRHVVRKMQSSARLKLTGKTPVFQKRNSSEEKIFISIRDMFAQRKQNNLPTRSEIVSMLEKKFGMDVASITSTISKLVYRRGVLEVVSPEDKK